MRRGVDRLGISADRKGVAVRREPGELAETRGEMALAAEAAGEGDVRKGRVPGGEQRLRVLDAATQHVQVRTLPGRLLEAAGEVVGAQAGDRRQIADRKGLVEIRLDERGDAAERCRRDPAAGG